MLCKQKPYFAFYLGAGDNRKADQAATQGLVLAVIHCVVMTVCCIAMMPAFLPVLKSKFLPSPLNVIFLPVIKIGRAHV